MGLDINTPKGQETLYYEKKMIEIISSKWICNGISFIETNKKLESICDGFLCKENILIGIYESKCRNLTMEELNKFGSWLVTADKIEECRRLSKILKIPFLGFLYLIPENKVLMWKITDENGDYLFEFKKESTQTRKTVNGGIAFRINAFLDIKYAKEIN